MVDSSIRFMVDSSIHFKVVPTKSIPLVCMIQLWSAAWAVISPRFAVWVLVMKKCKRSLEIVVSWNNWISRFCCKLWVRMWTGYYIPRAYGPNPLFLVLQLAKILIHDAVINICWIWPVSGQSSAFQMYQILYTTLWTNANNPECTMIPPVAEFGFYVN